MKIQSHLKGAVAPIALSMALLAQPAFAQDTGDDCDPATEDCVAPSNTIIVTGTILRSSREAANPVQVIDADNLESRGVTTIEEAIQNIPANGAGNLPNAFTANGAFASGASAASLRGLTTSSTLVLFDGLRAAYYPLADDGTRNFVDLNTIPDAIVDRVEVLKDGASSTYGADAIGGVINVITKKQITGLHMGGEYGTAEAGFGDQYNLETTYGFGDLSEDGFNVYASARYFHQNIIYNRELDAPYNTGKGTICTDDGSDCLDNTFGLYLHGREFDGTYSGFIYTSLLDRALVAPYDPNTLSRTDNYTQLNPNLPCRTGSTSLTPDEAANNALADSSVCVYDLYGQFGVVQPESERINATLRATVALSDDIEAYAQFNYARSDVSYDFYDASVIRSSAPAETGVTFLNSPLLLPVYVCPGATYDADGTTLGAAWNNGCDAQNGTLNPNNPFASSGQLARFVGGLNDIQEQSRYKTDAFRAAFGVSGSFADDWYFNIDGTAMKVELDRTLDGRIYLANFLQAVANGSYNFVDPGQNSEEVRKFIAPTVNNYSTSEMYQLQGVVSRDLFDLPGGPVQAGVGVSWRHERVDAPGADSDGTSDPNLVDPLQRYTSRVNPFGSKGARTVWSIFGEATAPFTDWLELNLSGRYDDYSTGQSYFSPKAGIRITPIPEILIRGTFSKGFRIGSFAEFGATPTTGYINGTGTIPEDLQQAYADANGGAVPAYITSYSLGLTQSGNPSLDPEKSESWTLGFVAEPIRGVSFTVDYWHIKKTDLITGADYTPALEAYYAGQPIPEGFSVIPDVPANGNQYAGLLPRAGFVQYSFTNKDSGVAEGIDFAASATFPVSDGIQFTSSVEATYLIELSQTVDGSTQEYQGTIGPYVITSASGSPQWRGSWQNRLDFGRGYLSATVYYTDGYLTSAEDITGAGSRFDDCADVSLTAYTWNGEPYQCSVDSFTYVNLSAGYDIVDDVTLYVNVNNLFDADAPIDTATYGGYLYNPSWGHPGVMGRFWKVGIKADF